MENMKSQGLQVLPRLRHLRSLCLALALKQHRVIVCAGMPRSGSTWLFNTVRLLLLHSGNSVHGVWWRDIKFRHLLRKPKADHVIIIKIHGYQKIVADSAQATFYSYRDTRDVVASLKRKTGKDTPGLIKRVTKMTQGPFLNWSKRADFVMCYEKMISEPGTIVDTTAKVIGVSDYDVADILAALDDMSYHSPGGRDDRMNLVNMMHANHRTDGRHGSWENTLSAAEIAAIEEQMASWLTENGYLVKARD